MSVDRENANVVMFGVRNIDEWFAGVRASATWNYSPMMVVMSLLSDSQEELGFDPDMARKTINRAKYLLSILEEVK